ncbi:hypothetical protein [Flavobacterium piscis]|uniref:DUF4303 domain-containing protein n=1 Tax=Flavobacterium piscis TaxID=1114874 RepID=A0ABU1YCV6_9FLAO|nr:hypothetical protein [Flavobacterium piscis]MDR7212074.1 hypothetical protein [Flavobacterium piscis]
MKTKLSGNFYKKVNHVIDEKIENVNNKPIIKKIDWEELSLSCFNQIISFFDTVSVQNLEDNDIDKIGAVSFNWNQYDGNITIDFSPDNNEDTAFDEGYIMADTAIDNNSFFQKYFDCTGENSFETVGDDYTVIIYLFQLVIEKIISEITQMDVFNKLPRKSPCHFGFSAFDDELPEIFYSL